MFPRRNLRIYPSKLVFILISLAWVGKNSWAGYTSIHQLQVEEYRKFSSQRACKRIQSISKPLNRLNCEVFGFDPWWVDDSYLHYDLLTTIACFGVEAREDGEIENPYDFPSHWSSMIDYAHRAGVRVVLTLFSFDSWTIHKILTTSRDSLIENLLSLVKSAEIEGVNIDFEGVSFKDRENLVRFMEALTNRFHKQLLGSYVTICTPAVDWQDAFDYKSLGEIVDGLFIMGYDYHWMGSEIAGPVAPLSGWGRYNISRTIDTYLSEVSPDRLILGCPYYGYDWPTESDTVKSKTKGKGTAKTYSQARLASQVYGRRWDKESKTPWYLYNSFHQCWWDDEESLKEKYRLGMEKELKGIGMWALGYDGDRPELWTALREMVALPQDKFSNGGLEEWIRDTIATPSDTSLKPKGFWFGKYTRAVPESLNVKEGRYALCQLPDSLGDPYPLVLRLYQDVRIDPEGPYQFSGWVRRKDSFKGKVKLVVKWFSFNHRLLREDSSNSLSLEDDSFHLLETEVSKPPGKTEFARLGCETITYGGRVVWDNLSFSQISGIREDKFPCKIKVYPSISKRIVRIGCRRDKSLSIRVYNPLGQLVRSSSSTYSINLSSLPNGIYFLLIFLNDRPITVKRLTLLK